MGRHSSSDQGPFVRSFVGWIAMWFVIAAITGVAVWFLVNAIGGGGVEPAAVADDRETHAPEPTEEPETEPVVATETPAPEETEEEPSEVRLITEGITVQVLNGTLKGDAGEAMSTRLTDLGYTIVAVEESAQAYTDTTVFWSTAAAEKAARALAERFGWKVDAKPGNLSPDVSLHVVVGADEA